LSGYSYVGSELELFAAARCWKSYLRSQWAPFLGDDVLEVGAGLGGTTKVCCDAGRRRWVCLEPDVGLAGRLSDAIANGELPPVCEAVVGTLGDLAEETRFDSILYIDVLEHIEDDRAEVERAARHLRPGAHLIVLAPAHPFLYSPFDQAIGHYRRYTKRTLGVLTPRSLELVRLRYLDSVGLLASLGNRFILGSERPNPRQIELWDKFMVRASRVLDPLLFHALGKSVLAIWRRRSGGMVP
jgi:SAM-dependent methyltransferase